ncbi:MAG: type I restriction endonuclease subunit R [Candidatus Aminicenantales bacterium]
MIEPKYTEDTLSERPAIEQLRRLGYDYIPGEQLDPEYNEESERKSRKDVILVDRLRKKLAEINPHLNEASIDKAIRKITHIQAETILEANRIFHKSLISGISIDQDIGARRQKQTVNIIDFENIEKNEFLAVNQFWVRKYKTQDRPDIVLFVNGIPLVIMECKSPVAKNTGVADAQSQLLRYQEEIPQLFYTNEILIACNLFGARYGTIGAPLEHYHEWRIQNGARLPNMADHPTIQEMLELGLIEENDLSPNPPMQEVLMAGILKKPNLLDIIRNFIVFDYSKEEHKIIKKICRYQQYSAVNKIVKRVVEDPYKRGIIWHWQGSGKSLIMVFAATKLRREEEKLKNPTILIVTDRIKLDRQIIEQFRDCNFPNPIPARKGDQLYSLLRTDMGTDVGCTIMTTVQKFRKPLRKPLSDKENIIVMTDEAHRTQYGNFALNLRNALPNAAIFAFTGTPLNKRDRNTYRHFSMPGEKYLDRYTMKQSLEDGATVPIKFESRMANLQIVGASIDKLIKALFPEKSRKELAELKRRYATVNTILSAPRRIERIAMDIVSHYTQKILPNGFKAQIVAADKKTAVAHKDALDRLIDPSWSTVVITVDNDDPLEWKKKYRRTGTEEDHLTGKEVFLNPDHPLKILVVCDKLLTGFDAPILQAMYLDQRLREHTLLQAIARTNRPYSRKYFGLVVDYVGVGKELAKALAIFDKEDLEGFFSVDDIKKELAYLRDWHEKAMAMFRKVNREGKPQDVIQQCLEILRPEDTRAEFEVLFREYAKSMDILMPDPCVNVYLDDFKFLGLIREGAKNLYRDERLSLNHCSRKIENLIHAHIVGTGVEQILKPVDIMEPDFEEKLEIKGNLRAKASHMEYAIRESIISNVAEDPHFYESLQEDLESIIEDERKRRIDDAEYLKRLDKVRQKEKARENFAKEKGLSMDELAFYGLFEPYQNELFGGSDDRRCEAVKDLAGNIKSKIVIDWIDREDIKKEIRRAIKDQLKKIRFPDEKMETFTAEILSLAEATFKDYDGKN